MWIDSSPKNREKNCPPFKRAAAACRFEIPSILFWFQFCLAVCPILHVFNISFVCDSSLNTTSSFLPDGLSLLFHHLSNLSNRARWWSNIFSFACFIQQVSTSRLWVPSLRHLSLSYSLPKKIISSSSDSNIFQKLFWCNFKNTNNN